MDMEKALCRENDKGKGKEKKTGECGSESCDGESEETELKQMGGVIREASSAWFHTLRLASLQSITEGLSISCALLVAAQHPKWSHHTQVLEHLLISNIIAREEKKATVSSNSGVRMSHFC